MATETEAETETEIETEIKPKPKLKTKSKTKSKTLTKTKKRKPKPPPFQFSGRMKKVLWGFAAFCVLAVGTIFTGTQLENRDSFCASCHTQNEDMYYQRTLSTKTSTDLATFHAAKETRCIDCHTDRGITGRMGGLMAGVSDLYSFYIVRKYPQPAVQDKPIGDGNCLKCHDAVLQKQEFNNHFHVFLPRWQAADSKNAATCVSCHNSHGANGDVAIKYLNEKDTVLICQKCHAMAGAG